ncbi:MAG: arginine--tRNA ligase [Thermoplasmata archaeon]|nr:MAG: arginine--tRNA ligase [Thermoplasmata archaeon]
MKNNPYGACKEEVLASLKKVLSDLGYHETQITLETPPENLGDAAFSCFSLAKIAKKAPQKIAEEIALGIQATEYIEKCESVGPYVNFYFDSKKLAEMTMRAALDLKDEYGNSPPIAKKIILEHTSANPTDKLHIGRARNPIIGDTLARILKKAGYDVETQYYVDDMGRQAVTLAYGKKMHSYSEPPEYIPSSDRKKWKEIKEESFGPYQSGSTMIQTFSWAKKESDAWQNELEWGEPSITKSVKAITDETMEEKIKPTLEKLNVRVDNFVHESQFLKATKDLVASFKESEFCGEEDGAFYLDLSNYGIEKKFFFVRADGTTLYATRDIAYHLWKAQRGDEIINILGEDHKLEAKYVVETIKNILKKDLKIETIFYSFVSLPEGRMSTRKGKVVFMDDLLDESIERAEIEVRKRRSDILDDDVKKIAEIVGIGAVRYNLVNVQPEKKIVFRWEDALNFEGNSAPFIQYSHARASSILRKAKELGYEKYDKYNPTLLEHPSEINLIKEMARFPETIKECAERRTPHTMASYAYGLASMFNQFYRDCPVLACDDDQLRIARMALVDAGRIVLKNSLFCLGIDAPEEM